MALNDFDFPVKSVMGHRHLWHRIEAVFTMFSIGFLIIFISFPVAIQEALNETLITAAINGFMALTYLLSNLSIGIAVVFFLVLLALLIYREYFNYQQRKKLSPVISPVIYQLAEVDLNEISKHSNKSININDTLTNIGNTLLRRKKSSLSSSSSSKEDKKLNDQSRSSELLSVINDFERLRSKNPLPPRRIKHSRNSHSSHSSHSRDRKDSGDDELDMVDIGDNNSDYEIDSDSGIISSGFDDTTDDIKINMSNININTNKNNTNIIRNSLEDDSDDDRMLFTTKFDD